MLIIHSSENLYPAWCEIFSLRTLAIRKHKSMINYNTSVFQSVVILPGRGQASVLRSPLSFLLLPIGEVCETAKWPLHVLHPFSIAKKWFKLLLWLLEVCRWKTISRTIFKEDLINSLRVLVLQTQPLATPALKELALNMEMGRDLLCLQVHGLCVCVGVHTPIHSCSSFLGGGHFTAFGLLKKLEV